MIDIGSVQIFRNRTPEWLSYFAGQPVEAVDALFTNRFYHGPLSTVEPDSLLLDWVSAIHDQAFQVEVDAAMATWLRERWDRPDHAAPGADLMWQRAFRALANLDPVPEASIQALGDLFPHAGRRLGLMTRNRAHDPLGWFWAASSRVQPDDSFIDRWLQLCDLTPGTPLFHGHWGLVGLRRLTGRTPEQSMETIVLGLHHYLVALHRLVSDRRLPQNEARLLAVNECRWVKRAYPVAAVWREAWGGANLPDEARRWLASAGIGDRSGTSGRPRGRSHWDTATRGWAARARELVQGLGRARSAPQGMHDLLGEQREYTARTGDTYYLTRSLCQFSSKLANLRIDLSLATAWAEEAQSVDPLSAHPWTTLMRCWQRRDAAETAIGIGFEALDRFPHNVVVRNGLAEVLKAAGRLGEAEAVYRGAMERFPQDQVVRNGLAEVLKAAGRLDEAEAVYRGAMERFPQDQVVRNGLAEVLKAAGRLGEAEAVYRDAMERFPENVVVRNGLAEVLKAAGRLGEAEAVYRDAMERFPDNQVVRNGLAEVLKAAGRLDDAEAVYRGVMERFPQDQVVRNGLAEVLKAAGRLGEAEAVYRDAMERFPGNVVVRNGLADVLKAAGRLDDAEAVYRDAMQRFPQDQVVRNGLAEVLKAAGRLGEAEAVYRDAMQRFPGNVVVRNGLADVLKAAGRLDDAEAVYRDAMQRFPRDQVVRNGLAEVLKAAGRLGDAEAVYRDAMQRFPGNQVVRNGLAEVLKAAGRLDEAEAIYRDAVERLPDNQVVRNGLAEVLKAAGRLGEAEAVYRDAMQRFPGNQVVRGGLAEVLKAAGRLGEAEAVYRDAMQRFPGNQVIRGGLAEVLKAAGRLDDAEAVYRDAMQRFPGNQVVRSGLAEVLRAAGRLDEAEAVYRDAVQRFSGNQVVRCGLAEVLKAAGRLDEAEAVYRDAMERFPGNQVVRGGLAEVLKAAGRLDEAEAVYRDAIERFPSNQVIRGGLAEVRKELARGEPQASDGGETVDAVESPRPVEAAIAAPEPAANPGLEAGAQQAQGGRIDVVPLPEGPAAPIAPPLPVASLRSTVRRAMAADGESRRERLEAVLATVEAAVAVDGGDADALFARLEILVALGRAADAGVVLQSLPSYLRTRPDFEAMRGKIALAALHEAGSAPFGSEVIESVVKPWEAAVRSSAELRFMPVVQRLRVSAVMVDGAALEDFQVNASDAVREMLQQGRARAAAPATDPAGSLRSWWLTGVQRALTGDASPDDATTEQFVTGARERSDVLDALEDELLSASRYRIAIR